MQNIWIDIGTIIEFIGTLIIVIHLIHAIYILIYQSSILHARLLIAKGAIAGLDFKLAATLLKVLALLQWQQIGMFTAIYAIRFIVKKAFARELLNIKIL